ncbi:hypothetical protein DFH09DRAFT_1323894 [Mycena vulgaris]|nr:hypothetical protein DFH09DRAFT_1323894 [Mycena vulgaris]
MTMSLSILQLMLFMHPLEFRMLLQYPYYHISHDQKRNITAKHEHARNVGVGPHGHVPVLGVPRYDEPQFSSVIKELEGALARVVRLVLFYLALRALYAIEDDLDPPPSMKYPVLIEEVLRLPATYCAAPASCNAAETIAHYALYCH